VAARFLHQSRVFEEPGQRDQRPALPVFLRVAHPREHGQRLAGQFRVISGRCQVQQRPAGAVLVPQLPEDRQRALAVTGGVAGPAVLQADPAHMVQCPGFPLRGLQAGEDLQGLAVLCCRVVVPPRVPEDLAVIDGVTGLLVAPAPTSPASPVPAGDSSCAESLASAVAELLANPARSAQLGSDGARNAARSYSWPRVADQILDVYQRLLRA
jgi:hypothetical protein